MDKARLLASKAPHSSDSLYTLPITACGLRLSGEAIRVAVGLRLGLNVCAHIHALVEKWSPREGHTDYPVKEAPAAPLVTNRSTTRFGGL